MAEKAIGFHLKFENKSSKSIELLDAEHQTSLPRVKPGRSKTFDVLKIREKNKRFGIETWKIRQVLIDDLPFEIELETKDLLRHVIVNFHVQSDEDGKVVSFLVTGVQEVKTSDAFLRMGLGIDTSLGRNRIWKKRETVKIYEKDFRHEEPPQQPIIETETQVVELSSAPERAVTSLYKRKRVIKLMIKRNRMTLKHRVNSTKRRNSSDADLSSPMQHMNSSQHWFPLRNKFRLYFLSWFLLVFSLYVILLLL